MTAILNFCFPLMRVSAFGVLLLGFGCSSVPEPKVVWYKWPQGAYRGVPEKEFEKLGQVRTRIEYDSLVFDQTEAALCKNYYKKAAQDLVKRAQAAGADAVIDIKTVTFQLDGRMDTFDLPECVDDGIRGVVLAQGVAIKWKKPLAKGEKVRFKLPSTEDSRTPASRVYAPAPSAPSARAHERK